MDPNRSDQNQTAGEPVVDQPVNDQPIAEPAAKCSTCSMDTAGYKCAVCGEESATHDDTHPCGGENCQPKCVGCNQADSKCSCGAAQTPVGGGDQPASPMGGPVAPAM